MLLVCFELLDKVYMNMMTSHKSVSPPDLEKKIAVPFMLSRS